MKGKALKQEKRIVTLNETRNQIDFTLQNVRKARRDSSILGQKLSICGLWKGGGVEHDIQLMIS